MRATDSNPLVAKLEIVSRELAKGRVFGPDDNLFEAGLDSLTVTEIILAIEDRHPGEFKPSDIFDYPTLRQIADFVNRSNT